MNKEQVKHLFLSVDEEVFIKWYNNYVVDPFGDFSYCTIRENNGDEIFEWAKNTLDFEVFVNLCAKSTYSEGDRYFMFTDDSFISFDSIEELLKMKYHGDGIVDFFLDNEEESREAFLDYIRGEE